MPKLDLTDPLVFEPLFMERVWGGRRLETEYGKKLPPGTLVGESWEIVDRADAQSVVHLGPLRGTTLHELWSERRAEIFGAQMPDEPRFPLLVKLLDAQEKLSLQVHPPAEMAGALGGEPKTEMWYVAAATPDADLYAGLRRGVSREQFEAALRAGEITELVHRIPVTSGATMFVPSGRLHAIGAGNLIVEIQQNSDTTYRVFDWNRLGTDGKPRQLHVERSLSSIDFEDFEPALVESGTDDALVDHPLFRVEKWELGEARAAAARGEFAIVFCASGEVECGSLRFQPGDFFLVPAGLEERTLRPRAAQTSILRTTLPAAG